MDINAIYSGNSLKAADLQGAEPTVTIESIEVKQFDDGNKIIIKFQGKEKTFVCNKTNANRIASAYGSNTDNWLGQKITLYTDQVDFQGKLVDAIRVKVKKPVTKPADIHDDEIPF